MFQHPIGIMKQARLCIGIHKVEIALLQFPIQILAQDLQKHEIRPTAFWVIQTARRDIVSRMNATANELLRFCGITVVTGQCERIE